ncbi:MAG: hypothetical protein ABH840_02950 [Nanoarchaeota archaeon]
MAELEPIFKKSNVACEYLEYDSEKKTSGCKIYSGRRPNACMDFRCVNCKEETLRSLREVCDNIESYVGEKV